MDLAPSPVVALNRAVAVGMAEGPAAGLAALDAIAAGGDLSTHHLYWSVRADCLARLGDSDAAADAYEIALANVTNDVERTHIARRIKQLHALTINHATREEVTNGPR